MRQQRTYTSRLRVLGWGIFFGIIGSMAGPTGIGVGVCAGLCAGTLKEELQPSGEHPGISPGYIASSAVAGALWGALWGALTGDFLSLIPGGISAFALSAFGEELAWPRAENGLPGWLLSVSTHRETTAAPHPQTSRFPVEEKHPGAKGADLSPPCQNKALMIASLSSRNAVSAQNTSDSDSVRCYHPGSPSSLSRF